MTTVVLEQSQLDLICVTIMAVGMCICFSIGWLCNEFGAK